MTAALRSLRRPGALLLLALGLLAAPRARAAVEDGGVRSVFALGAGNRALALGGAYAAVANDASAALWNPAGLAALERRRLEATHTDLFGMGYSEQYLSLGLPSWRRGATSLTVRVFGVDGIERRDDRNVLLGADLKDRETELILAHARRLRPGLDLGLGLKMQQQSLAGYSGGGFGLDLGLLLRPLALASGAESVGGWSLGFAVRNLLEPAIRLDQENVPDPRAVRVGSAWRGGLGGSLDGLLSLDLEKTAGMDPRLHAGAELAMNGSAALRAGVLDGSLTAGFGLQWKGVAVDFAFEDHRFGAVKRLGVSLLHGDPMPVVRARKLAEAEAAKRRALAEAFAANERQRRDDLLAEARDALAGGLHERALSVLAMVRTLDPDHGPAQEMELDALRELARDQERGGDPDLAAITLQRLLAIRPHDVQAQADLERLGSEAAQRNKRTVEIQTLSAEGLDAFAADDLDTAETRFRAVLELNPEDRDARAMLDRIARAREQRRQVLADEVRSYARAGLVEEAAQALERYRTAGGDDAVAAELAAGVDQARRRRDTERELRRRELARQAELAAMAGTAQAAAPAADPGEEEPRLGPARRAELERLAARGRDRYAAGDVAEAVRIWELVWAEDPDNATARDALRQEYLSRGMEHFSAGRLDEAVASWEEALRVDPEDRRVRSYLDRGRQQQARIRRLRADGGS